MQPDYPQQPGYPQQPPVLGNNMTMSIVALFFFWPTAIAAVLNAAKVNPALQIGDVGSAQIAVAESKKWAKISIIIGACGIVLCCGLLVILFSAATTVKK